MELAIIRWSRNIFFVSKSKDEKRYGPTPITLLGRKMDRNVPSILVNSKPFFLLDDSIQSLKLYKNHLPQNRYIFAQQNKKTKGHVFSIQKTSSCTYLKKAFQVWISGIQTSLWVIMISRIVIHHHQGTTF